MRAAKILGIFVSGIVVVFGLALLAVWCWVNPTDYQGKLVRAVKQSTGRDLVLQGDIRLSVFPWIALQVGPATLGNPPGFGAAPFASFAHATVRPRLLPLFRHRLVIDRVDIQGLDVRLSRNAAGNGNWEGLGGSRVASSGAGAGAIAGASASADAGANAGATAGTGTVASMNAIVHASESGDEGTDRTLEGLTGIRLRGARISYQNVTIEKLTLDTGPFADNGLVPVMVGFDINRGARGEHATVAANFALSMDAATRQYRFAAVTLNGLLSRPDSSRRIRWGLSAPTLDVNLAAQTLAAPAFALTFAGADLTGRLQGSNILGDVGVAGSVSLAPLILREFIPYFGIAGPNTRDPKALAQASGSTDFTYSADELRLSHVNLTLDETHLRGSLTVPTVDGAPVSFDLAADRIDVDRYLRPRENSPDAGSPASEPAMGGKDFQANGTLSVGRLAFSGRDFTNARLTLSSKDDVIHLFPSEAQIDGGGYSGDITLDRSGSLPVLKLDEHLSDIDMARWSANGPKSGRVSGRGTFTLKATARGSNRDAMFKSLNGHIDAYLTEGVVEGFDLGYELSRAQAWIKRGTPPVANTRRTKFDACKASAEITNGIASTTDLAISSQYLRVTGRGSTNLLTQTLDLQLMAAVLKSPLLSGIDIPVTITGTLSDPKARPDIETLAKGQLGQKLRETLQDKLQSLLGTP